MHTDSSKNGNKMFETRRYVVIVPYQTRNQDGSIAVISSLLNTAVLIFWFIGAAFFTVLRIGMRELADVPSSRITPRSKTSIYFGCLARVLGNSAGNDYCLSKCESFLMFVIGVFATLASMLFTGALFEQLVGTEPPKQFESLAELNASNLTIVLCSGDVYIGNRLVMEIM